jgi:hypothetical protein
VHITNVSLIGQLKIEGGELWLIGCTIEPATNPSAGGGNPGRQLDTPAFERALSMDGGRAMLAQVVVRRFSSGAIGVHAASLIIVDCVFQDCHARKSGGAILVDRGATVTIARSLLTGNSALSGGAMLVAGDSDIRVSESIFSGNRADVRGGALQVWRTPEWHTHAFHETRLEVRCLTLAAS